MKKILLGTSALFVAGMIAGSAVAAPVKLNVGGYANWYVGYVDLDEEAPIAGYNHVPVTGDVELAFSGETTLQNGTKFGALIEIAGISDGSVAEDQSYIYMDSAYGRFVMGKMNSFSRQIHAGAKDVGLLGIQDSDVSLFIPTLIDNLSTDSRALDLDQGLTYISPKVGGVTFSATYAEQDAVLTNSTGNDVGFGATVAYNNTFGKTAVDFDVTYTRADLMDAVTTGNGSWTSGFNGSTDGKISEIATGLRVGFDGFSFGAGYKLAEGDWDQADNFESNTFDVGVAYEKGPYGVSLSYIYGEYEQGTGTSLENEMFLLSGSYNIAAGVDTFASFAYVNTDGDQVAESYSGFAVITGLGLSF